MRGATPWGSIPATPGFEQSPVLGLIAHVDTSPDMSGCGVKPRVIENYDGSDIRLNGELTMRVEDFPELRDFVAIRSSTPTERPCWGPTTRRAWPRL